VYKRQDVLEDAERGRVYLPESRLRAAGGSQEELLRGGSREAARTVVADLLTLAEEYYRSADHGLRYIPARSRAAIGAAGRMYRAIGLKLAARSYDPFAGRAFVGLPGKVRWTLSGVVRAWIAPWAHRGDHDTALHTELDGLTVRAAWAAG